MSDEKTTSVPTAPPLDLGQPEAFATATFAMG